MPNKDGHETKRERYERQTKEQFEALGRYVQAFELMVHAVRAGCVGITSASVAHQRLMNIVFSHKALTAQALFDIFASMIGEIILDQRSQLSARDRETVSSILGQAASEYGNAVFERNDLIHGTWFIGWASEHDEDFSRIAVHKGKATKKGFQLHQPVANVDDIKNAMQRCEALKDFINEIRAWFILRDRDSISDYFIREKGTWRRRPPHHLNRGH